MTVTTTISLPELVADSALLTRVDRKYLLPVSQLSELQDRLDGSVRVGPLKVWLTSGFMPPV